MVWAHRVWARVRSTASNTLWRAWRLVNRRPPRVVIRPIHANDLDRLFPPAQRILGERWLAQQERGELYVAVAEVNGSPVGHRCLNLKSGDPEKTIGYCFAVFVFPKWRSRGIGAKLDAHMENVARTHNLRELHCAVGKENKRSLSWHERLGYQCTGERVRRWTCVDGREVEVDCWEFKRAFKTPQAAETVTGLAYQVER